MDWISVNDRLPEDMKPVTVWWEHLNLDRYFRFMQFFPIGSAIAIRYEGEWYWCVKGMIYCLHKQGKSGFCGMVPIDKKDVEITKWMPLPNDEEKMMAASIRNELPKSCENCVWCASEYTLPKFTESCLLCGKVVSYVTDWTERNIGRSKDCPLAGMMGTRRKENDHFGEGEDHDN